MTAHGVSAGKRALAAVLASSPSDPSGCWGDSVVRSATRATMRWSAMGKTKVLEGTNSGGAGGLPFFPVPVQMSTWSATSRWVEGMLAKSGAESADVRPGSTVTRDAMPPRREEAVFLAAAPVHKRVSLLQSQHRLAASYPSKGLRQELVLRGIGVAGTFPRNHHRRAARDQVHHPRRNELVCENEVGREDCIVRCSSEEAGVAGTRACENESARWWLWWRWQFCSTRG